MENVIKKSHIKAVEKFNAELQAFAKECEAEEATLYEDAFTDFTLSNVRVEDNKLKYVYDGAEEAENLVLIDEETGEVWEDEIDGVTEWLKFWRSCLRRAKKYWAMSPDDLDAIQDGDKEDID